VDVHFEWLVVVLHDERASRTTKIKGVVPETGIEPVRPL
jgi:hypothetical protein